MVDELVFLTQGNERGERILAAFAERTGLTPEPITAGVRFALHEDDHGVKVLETLTDIDADWSRHLTLEEPRSTGDQAGESRHREGHS
jgi:hypothetical protein